MKLNKLKPPLRPLSWITLSVLLAGVGLSPSAALPASKLLQFRQVQGSSVATSGKSSCQSQEDLGRPQQQQEEQKTQMIRQGSELYNSGNFAGAEALLRQMIKQYPKDAYLHYKLGSALYRQSNLEEAATEYQKAIGLNPEYAVAYNALGMIRASQGQWSEATAKYQQALSLNPEYAEALANLGEALWQQGKRTDAIASLEKAKKLFTQQDEPRAANKIDQLLLKISGEKPAA